MREQKQGIPLPVTWNSQVSKPSASVKLQKKSEVPRPMLIDSDAGFDPDVSAGPNGLRQTVVTDPTLCENGRVSCTAVGNTCERTVTFWHTGWMSAAQELI